MRLRTKTIRKAAGARDVRLFRNGSLVKVWHGDVLKGQSASSLEEEITVTAGPNRLVAYAFNKDNVKSKDAPLVFHRRRQSEAKRHCLHYRGWR